MADLGPLDAGIERASLLQAGMAPTPGYAPVAAPAGYHAWGSPANWPAPGGAGATGATGAAAPGGGVAESIPEPASADGSASTGQEIDPLGAALADLDFPIDLPARLEAVERELILRALRQTGFNRTAAAPLLGLNFRQLRYRIQQLGIRDEREGRDGREAAEDGESLAEGEGRDA